MHEGHRDRLRARFLRDGLDTFEPHNVLELLLFYAIPRKDTNELAHSLIQKFGSVAGVLDASRDELMEVKGISENAACFLKLMTPLFRYYNADKVDHRFMATTTEAAGSYLMDRYVGFTEEMVSLLCMDNVCRVIGFEVLGKGGVNAVGFSSRRVMEAVLHNHATSVILCHNHPGGLALPSDQDVRATIRIKRLLDTVGVRLLDHIILVDNDYISMADTGGLSDIFRTPRAAAKQTDSEKSDITAAMRSALTLFPDHTQQVAERRPGHRYDTMEADKDAEQKQ